MEGKKIVIGVSGGIAAYKVVELVRMFVKAGYEARVAMTANATRFVSPLTFETLSGNRVIFDMWGQKGTGVDHISWGQETDLIVLAPATANLIAKIAHGIGDDFLSTMIIAATAKILVCPSMNNQMYLNPATQNNLELLRVRGFVTMEPGEGNLACHTEGPGRLPEPEKIFEQASILLTPQDLSGMKILVTAGATVEPIDPVRYISNRSSGKMGLALARAARRRGTFVTLVSGPTGFDAPYGVTLCSVKTAEEMRQAVLKHCPDCHAIIKAAAVSDYRPKKMALQKIKKGADSLNIELVKNPDILLELGDLKKKSQFILVGFAAETEDLFKNAESKLRAKNLDLIVANDVSRSDAGFETDTNQVKIIHRDGNIDETALISKDEVADLVLDKIKVLWDGILED